VTTDPAGEKEMRLRSGQDTVPQVFIGGNPVGGCSDLFELDEKGELDRLLQLKSPGG
jgi:glutaredoxin 3